MQLVSAAKYLGVIWQFDFDSKVLKIKAQTQQNNTRSHCGVLYVSAYYYIVKIYILWEYICIYSHSILPHIERLWFLTLHFIHYL